jgi:hypothetical protein
MRDRNQRRLLRIGIGLTLCAPMIVVATQAERAAAAPPPVVINELQYHPEDDDPASEFIELHNTGSSAVNLAGWCIDGINYCFPAGSTISANGFIVRYGNAYEGRLSNGGEDITLLDASNNVVDFVEYDDKEEWPGYADGEGPSLQRRDPFAASDTGANWESGPQTPGAPNSTRANGLLPAFSAVEHTHLPAPGEPIEIAAEVHNATNALLVYRIGFGTEVGVPADVDADGNVTASIPGQPAGTLVRYRLSATRGGLKGFFPRQGDGSL